MARTRPAVDLFRRRKPITKEVFMKQASRVVSSAVIALVLGACASTSSPDGSSFASSGTNAGVDAQDARSSGAVAGGGGQNEGMVARSSK
jgi:hypothetical protein